MATTGKSSRYILVYDVYDDATRKQLHRRVKKWMRPIQRSAFEGALTKKELGKVMMMVEQTIDLKRDMAKIFKQTQGYPPVILGTAKPLDFKILKQQKAKVSQKSNPYRKSVAPRAGAALNPRRNGKGSKFYASKLRQIKDGAYIFGKEGKRQVVYARKRNGTWYDADNLKVSAARLGSMMAQREDWARGRLYVAYSKRQNRRR